MNLSAEPHVDVADEWPPRWVDADGLVWREYGDAQRVHIEGQRLRCTVTESSKFILWFMLIFSILFFCAVYPTIKDPEFRAFFLFMAPIALFSIFTIGYGVTKHHENLRDYVLIDAHSKTVELPRYGVTIDYDRIVCFQYIRGYRYPSPHLKRKWNRQLNLLVLVDDDIVRYHVTGNPSKSVVRDIVDFSGIPIVDTTCPSGFFLSSDANGNG